MTTLIEHAINNIVAANPDKVEQAKVNHSLIGWFVGRSMNVIGDMADYADVEAMVKAKFEKME